LPPQYFFRFEGDLDKNFLKEILSEPGGETINKCIQCGTCSSICPVSIYMDYTPRQLIAMAKAGFRSEVLNSKTIWICTSCYGCTTYCPGGVKITEIMYVLKRIAMREGIEGETLVPELEKIFCKMVRENGRINEVQLGMRLGFKAGLRRLLELLPAGLKLMKRNRLPLSSEKIRDAAGLRRAIEEVIR